MGTDTLSEEPLPARVKLGGLGDPVANQFGPPTSSPVRVSDFVQFSAAAPAVMAPGSQHAVYIWLHTDAQRPEVKQQAEEAISEDHRFVSSKREEMARGSTVLITLSSPHLTIEEPQQTAVWRGEIETLSFGVTVLETVPAKVLLKAKLSVEGLVIASLLVAVKTDGATTTDLAESEFRRVNRAFASHASQDKLEVLKRIEGMRAVAKWMTIFYDTASFHSADLWKSRLVDEIDRSDMLYLFWSESASKSEWVEKEWRRAFANKRHDGITPVPLVSPRIVPPPPELADELHFDDWTLAFEAYERETASLIASQTRPAAAD